MIGIYKITNKINKKSYIGQSIHIEQRWQEHLYQSTKCSLIKYALFKYGQENFTFEVIEECPQELLNEREQYWIKYYNTYEEGYNLTLGGGGTIKYSVETIYEDYCQTNSIQKTAKNIGCHPNTVRNVLREYGINHSEQQEAKSVQSINPNTLQIIKTFSSIEEAAQEMGVTHNAIKLAADGTNKSSCGLYWKYTNQEKQFEKGKARKNKVKVAQLNYNTEEIIREFETISDAAEFLGKDRKNGGTTITAVCRGRKQSAYGYKWKYLE